MNRLYFGDNLLVLRNDLAAESVDLVYLDPPFNSKRDYNVVFRQPKKSARAPARPDSGDDGQASVTAFLDTWAWGRQAEEEFHDLMRQPNTQVAELMRSLRLWLRETDMMAYLVMMASRLLEIHRVMKPNASLWLHCDPTASHYVKLLLDAVFGVRNYQSEVSWRRSSAHNDAKQGRKKPGNIRDILFFYTKSDTEWTWNWIYTPYDEEYIATFYRHVEPETGRRYTLSDATAARPGGDVSYEFHGTKPYKNRFWAYSKDNMEKFLAEGRLYFPASGGPPRIKNYMDEMPGVPVQNDWVDIRPVPKSEYLGYPTQKPLALLERIIQASSNPGDVVLDPFCGCGTAIHAAEKLGRNWIGIDITHLAIALIEKRINDAFRGIKEGFAFDVQGTPKDISAARDLARRDKYQFQWWALSLINAQPHQGKKKGADGGIDGLIYFGDVDPKTPVEKIVVSVKGGETASLTAVRELISTVLSTKAAIGILVTLAPPTKAMAKEAAAAGTFQSAQGRLYQRIQILTIEGLLDGSARPEYPDYRPNLNFKPAARETAVDQEDLLED